MQMLYHDFKLWSILYSYFAFILLITLSFTADQYIHVYNRKSTFVRVVHFQLSKKIKTSFFYTDEKLDYVLWILNILSVADPEI